MEKLARLSPARVGSRGLMPAGRGRTTRGEHFGDTPDAYPFRAASSLLYGNTAEQRREELYSPGPRALPWIASTLSLLRAALASRT